MGNKLLIKEDLEGVDWCEMKSVLMADDFDNGRTPEQLQRSFANSYATTIATINGQIVGTARVLSDGVCNAYMVDVWTLSIYRHRGIAGRIVSKLLAKLEGQHVYLFTDDTPNFYRKLGFVERGIGMETLVGRWLQN